MTVAELIEKLRGFPPNAEVAAPMYDPNGGGNELFKATDAYQFKCRIGRFDEITEDDAGEFDAVQVV